MSVTKTHRKTLKEQFTPRISARIGVMGAIAAVLYALVPGIPIIPPIYKLDFSTAPVLISGFAMGPLPALCVLLIKDFVGMFHSSTMYVGELADFVTAAAMTLTCCAVYKRHRTLRGALVGMLLGVAVMGLSGAAANYFIMIPFYVKVMNMPMEAIVSLIAKTIPAVDSLPKLILLATVPFNLLKGVALSLVTFALYKRLSPILKKGE